MIDLIEKLTLIAAKADKSDVQIIKAAIDRIKQLEAKLSEYDEDITDWQEAVQAQMMHRTDNK